jgi:hypothetical protein
MFIHASYEINVRVLVNFRHDGVMVQKQAKKEVKEVFLV